MSGQIRANRSKTPQSAAAIILAKKAARFAVAPTSTSKSLSLRRQDTPYPFGPPSNTKVLSSARLSSNGKGAPAGGTPTPGPASGGSTLKAKGTTPSTLKPKRTTPMKRTATVFNLRTGCQSARDMPTEKNKRKRQKQRSRDLDSDESDYEHANALDADEDEGGLTEEYHSEEESTPANKSNAKAAEATPTAVDEIQNSDAETEHGEDPVLKDSDRTGDNLQKLVSRNGESRCWMYFSRGYIACSGPTELPGCAMYQPVHPVHAAPLFLIENTPTLAELALTRGGNVAYAKRCATMYHKHRRKARTQYNGTLAEALFTEKSANCLAHNVLRGGTGPMTLSPALAHLGNTGALAELIESDKMLTDPALFKLWRGAHASGDIYGTKKQAATKTLDTFLSVNYEAHARLECVQRLSYQGFRHGHTPTYLAEQARKFRLMRKLVRKDRLNNLSNAEEHRMDGLPSTEAEQDAMDMLNSGGLADTTEDERDE